MLGAIFIGAYGGHVFPFSALAFLVVALSLIDVLLRPQREMRSRGLRHPSPGELPRLEKLTRSVAREMRLPRTPTLLLSSSHSEVYTMGSFRRWYVVWGQDNAYEQERQLARPEASSMGVPVEEIVRVKIIHELAHFKHGDVLRLGYLDALLSTSRNVMLWGLLFFGGWSILLILLKQQFFRFFSTPWLEHLPSEPRLLLQPLLPYLPSPEQVKALQEKVDNINIGLVLTAVLNSTLPYVVLSILLHGIYYPLLWRVREFYADARVLQTQKSRKPFLAALLYTSKRTRMLPYAEHPVPEIPLYVQWYRRLHDKVSELRQWWQLRFWPAGQRIVALSTPEAIYFNTKQTIFILGFLTLSLEVLLSTPSALVFTGENPLLFPTVLVLGGAVYFLLPGIVKGRSITREGIQILLVVFFIRFVWLIFTLGIWWALYFLSPNMLKELLVEAIASAARYAGTTPIEVDLSDFLIQASFRQALQQPLILATQISALLVMTKGIRRLLQWYDWLGTATRFRKTVFWSMAGLVGGLVLTIIPLENAALGLQRPSPVLTMLGGAILLGEAAWFFWQDRHYYARCPSCGSRVRTDDLVGCVCNHCQTSPLPWLVQDEV